MRALAIYLMFGVASSYADHGLHYATVLFWRDVVAWPLIALDRVVDLNWLVTPRGQDIISLGFAAALIVYVAARFEWPSARRSEARRRKGTPAI